MTINCNHVTRKCCDHVAQWAVWHHHRLLCDWKLWS